MAKTEIPHEEQHDIPDEHHRQRTGGWMPADHRLHKEWLGKQVEHVDQHPKELSPVLKEFQKLIETNARLYMYFTVSSKSVRACRSMLTASGHVRRGSRQEVSDGNLAILVNQTNTRKAIPQGSYWTQADS